MAEAHFTYIVIVAWIDTIFGSWMIDNEQGALSSLENLGLGCLLDNVSVNYHKI